MKHLFLGIALLLATTAVAQRQTINQPVMSISDPDLYLELDQHKASPAKPAPATQPARSGTPDTADREPLAEYLLQLAAWEACCPDKYAEEMAFMYTYLPKGETPLTAEQLEYLVLARRLRK